jgi:hypothetical protein
MSHVSLEKIVPYKVITNLCSLYQLPTNATTDFLFVLYQVALHTLSWFLLSFKQWVRKDMDVNEHERLSKFTLGHKLK